MPLNGFSFSNYERPHKANGGKPPLMAARLLHLIAVKNGRITIPINGIRMKRP